MKYYQLIKIKTSKNITFCKHLVIPKDPAIPLLDTDPEEMLVLVHQALYRYKTFIVAIPVFMKTKHNP